MGSLVQATRLSPTSLSHCLKPRVFKEGMERKAVPTGKEGSPLIYKANPKEANYAAWHSSQGQASHSQETSGMSQHRWAARRGQKAVPCIPGRTHRCPVAYLLPQSALTFVSWDSCNAAVQLGTPSLGQRHREQGCKNFHPSFSLR